MPKNEADWLVHNRIRALAEVVSIDAWHDAFGSKRPRSSLFADITFKMARLGGDEDAAIWFKLAIRRADIIATVRESEGLRTDPNSVHRPGRKAKGTRSLVQTKNSQARAEVGVRLSSGEGFPTASGSASAAQGTELSETTEIQEEFSIMIVTHSLTRDGHRQWTVERGDQREYLQGKPWKPTETARLDFLVSDSAIRSKIEPELAVEVRCMREDLYIDDLEYKEGGIWKKFSSRDAKLAAAEQYIKTILVERGLEVGKLSDPYAWFRSQEQHPSVLNHECRRDPTEDHQLPDRELKGLGGNCWPRSSHVL